MFFAMNLLKTYPLHIIADHCYCLADIDPSFYDNARFLGEEVGKKTIFNMDHYTNLLHRLKNISLDDSEELGDVVWN